jgi:hypothetical protein
VSNSTNVVKKYSFENQNMLKNALVHNNAGVVAVKSEAVGLGPGNNHSSSK